MECRCKSSFLTSSFLFFWFFGFLGGFLFLRNGFIIQVLCKAVQDEQKSSFRTCGMWPTHYHRHCGCASEGQGPEVYTSWGCLLPWRVALLAAFAVTISILIYVLYGNHGGSSHSLGSIIGTHGNSDWSFSSIGAGAEKWFNHHPQKECSHVDCFYQPPPLERIWRCKLLVKSG